MEIEEEYDVCPVCYRVHGQAFNGVLQLRNPTDDAVLLVEYEVDKNHERGSFCIQKLKVPNGYDYRLATAQFTRHLGKALQQRFGGEYKETARLVTRSRQTSKDLYRITVLFRFPDFKKDDIVTYKGREVKILNLGSRVYVQDIKTHKKQQVRYEDVQK